MKQKHLQHFFLRAGFGIGLSELNELRDLSKRRVVDRLFLASKHPDPLRIDLSELEKEIQMYQDNRKLPDRKKMQELNKKHRQKIRELNYAWIDTLCHTNTVLNEKMTLFWANVFVCRDNNAIHFQHYNNTLREYALGNFRDFVKAVAREPSMSKYLNNRQNVKESPNENFARELMELFTLGIGNYTEQDIKEAARAFTGWSFKRNGDFFLRKFKHDYGEKTFLGKTGQFNGDDIIDTILEQKQCARFICEKIYRYFVNPVIDRDRVEELTDIFYASYDIEDLMRHIFRSDWFYHDENIGVKIKSPIELLVGINTIVPMVFKNKKQLYYLQKMMGQVLLYPVNVAGWKGDKTWIDSNTLMFRMKLPSLLLNNAVINLEEKGEFEDTFANYYRQRRNNKFLKVTSDWDSFNRQYGELKPNELKRLLLVSKTDEDTESLVSNLKVASNRDFCIQLMSLPEYQLC
ncbi:DUF1800 domain-containing protein [Aestuariivivens sediminicola]|uniref:DUF1800 domain-containing protein n=1 Tax=Aestuariivivens sediminicola TaxID=2913560 RepID=UPI001F59286B|nr:DUF1800 domain-containing protein [Aestuariivivens sediminicola]